MQLKIQRSQRAGGIVGNTVFFCLDVRADYSPEELANIQKYKLGGQVIYNSQAARQHLESAGAHLDKTQVGDVGGRLAGLARGAASMAMAKLSLNISIASLGKGHHIECKDLEELLEAEDTVRAACKNVTRFLDAADTFNGSETVIAYEKGEEIVHTAQATAPLLMYAASDASPSEPNDAASLDMASTFDLGRKIRSVWSNPKIWRFIYIVVGVIIVVYMFRRTIARFLFLL